MKKAISVVILLIATCGILVSCSREDEQLNDAREKVIEATKQLKVAKRLWSKEYPKFKMKAENRIASHEKNIAELKLNKAGTIPLDEVRKHRINRLEKMNAASRKSLSAYEIEHPDWESFKREFDQDMEGIGKEISDLGNEVSIKNIR
jgi:hypothetical protein